MSSPVWHPFTQHALRHDFPGIVRTEGAYLHTRDGRRILDAICSWWVITHGHRHPAIVDAVKRQLDSLDQVIFAEFTHEPAETLAHRLLEVLPQGLSHVFYSDSGSTAVEVALKMALGYWRHRGETRSRLVVLEHGYHGDTVGAMSVGERGLFTRPYEPLLFQVERIPFPASGREAVTLDALEHLCRRQDTAALLVEPLVLGAGGMLMYPAATLRRMREICTRFGILFLADEVMTGWGRTGTRFACEQAHITPDILCSSKGLTGGLLPLAVTACIPSIFEAHFSTDRERTFWHSSSFTANPVACAAGLANLEVWSREPVSERIGALTQWQTQELARLHDLPGVRDPRQCGTITAFDVAAPDAGYLATVGPRLHEFFRDRSVLLRPLGNTVYVMPPYCITRNELHGLYDIIREALDTLVR